MRLKAFSGDEEAPGFKKTTKLWRVSMIFTIIGLIVFVVGFSTPHFNEDETEKYERNPSDPRNGAVKKVVVDYYIGLWQKCVTITVDAVRGRVDCQDMDNDDAWKPICKVLCCLGLIASAAGVFVALPGGRHKHTPMIGTAGTLILTGAALSAIGCTVFTIKAKHQDSHLDPSYSVYLALIGCVFMVVGGGLQLLSMNSEYKSLS